MYREERKVADCEKMNAEILEIITAYGFPEWETLTYATRDKTTGKIKTLYSISESNWVYIFNYIHCYGLNKWGKAGDKEYKPYDEVLDKNIRNEARPGRFTKSNNPEITDADWTNIENAAHKVIYKWSSGYIREARRLEEYIREREKAAATN